MAYIDKDKLRSMTVQRNRIWDSVTDSQGRGLSEIIDSIPTADVVERKNGTWIDNKGLYQCSCCKHIWSELWWVESCPMDRMNKLMRYCPNCGSFNGEE